jgi:hypothetical protein
VADRLFLPSADAGGVVTDATRVADRLVALGHRLAGGEPPDSSTRKGGARFHFEYPGSLQGFAVTAGAGAEVENVAGHDRAGLRALAVRFPVQGAGAQARVTTPTMFPLAADLGTGYGLHGSPALHPGQRLRYGVSAAAANREALRVAPVAATAAEHGTSDLSGPQQPAPKHHDRHRPDYRAWLESGASISASASEGFRRSKRSCRMSNSLRMSSLSPRPKSGRTR